MEQIDNVGRHDIRTKRGKKAGKDKNTGIRALTPGFIIHELSQ